MHPLERVRQVASYALAALLVLNAAFCFAMTALALTRWAQDDHAYGASEAATFAALTAVFALSATFFGWYGRRAGR